MKPHGIKGVYAFERRIYTKNLVKGSLVYGERIISEGGEEYREWDVRRSKIAAGIAKGLSQSGIKEDSFVLYLGAATGTTVSHVSDIAVNGRIFAVDNAPRVMRELVLLSGKRKNITPVFASANHPEEYLHLAADADVVFQDVAQKNQVEIFVKNCDLYLKKGGFGLLSVKARSIDVSKNPKVIFADVKKQLEKKYTLVDYRELYPFQRDHALFVYKK